MLMSPEGEMLYTMQRWAIEQNWDLANQEYLRLGGTTEMRLEGEYFTIEQAYVAGRLNVLDTLLASMDEVDKAMEPILQAMREAESGQ